MTKPPKDTIQVKVRMPKALHRFLMRDAEHGGQTLNAEILRRLKDSYLPSDRNLMDKVLTATVSMKADQKKIAADQNKIIQAIAEKMAKDFAEIAKEAIERKIAERSK